MKACPIALMLACLALAGCGASSPTSDAGLPAADAGLPAADAGLPAADAGTSHTCGTRGSSPCGAAEYCAFARSDCGAADTGGTCTARPQICPQDCPGTCGCDGHFYCNACIAHAAGVEVSSARPDGGTCGSP